MKKKRAPYEDISPSREESKDYGRLPTIKGDESQEKEE